MTKIAAVLCLLAMPALIVMAQNPTLNFDTPDFTLKLAKASQTIAALEPKGAGGFDFTPADRLANRTADRFNSLGDLNFRARIGTSGPWQDYSTSAARRPVQELPSAAPILAAADLAATLPANCPIQVIRRWLLEDGHLVLQFELKNNGSLPVQIGALGMPMIFNNMLTGRPLTQMEEVNSFYDPAINEDGGYLQVTRLNGHDPALIVVPHGKTPFEAWRILNEPNGPNNMFSRGNPYEGSFEWMVHSQAYGENEWTGKEEWNPPSMATLSPNETRRYGVKFLVSPHIRGIEQTLAANGRPVAVGIPGYIIPMDVNAQLFLNYAHKVSSIKSEPAGAIAVEEHSTKQSAWKAYTLHGETWGRVRLVISYDDGTSQALSYYVIKSASQAVADLGNFLFTRQWYLDHAFQTANYLGTHNNIGNSRDGLMDGTIFLLLLDDLKRESWGPQASALESQLKAHAEEWSRRAVPFGSEMAWDSTGQEEIYGVTKYFGANDKAQITLDSVLGFMPSIPHWGYNGNARRFWDFFYGAAPGGTSERQLHHYGSGLNAIPVLSAFRDTPEDPYLLRVGYGGAIGGLSNIDQEGFAGTAFHSFPQNMRWDTYSGDYGPNFFGVAVNAGTYVVNLPEFGWQAFGGNVKVDGDWVKVAPLDAFRQRVYIAPRGLWLTLDSGTFEAVEIQTKTHAVRVALSPSTPSTPQARLRIEQPAKVAGIGVYHLSEKFPLEREAYDIPLQATTRWIQLTD